MTIEDTLSGATSYLMAAVTGVIGATSEQWLVGLAIVGAAVRLAIDIPKVRQSWRNRKDIDNGS